MATLIVYNLGKRTAYSDSQAQELGYDNVRHMARSVFAGYRCKIVDKPSHREQAYKNMSGSYRSTKHSLV